MQEGFQILSNVWKLIKNPYGHLVPQVFLLGIYWSLTYPNLYWILRQPWCWPTPTATETALIFNSDSTYGAFPSRLISEKSAFSGGSEALALLVIANEQVEMHGGWEKPCVKMPQTPTVLIEFWLFSLNKCFPICCIPDYCPDLWDDIFDNCVQFSSLLFGNGIC